MTDIRRYLGTNINRVRYYAWSTSLKAPTPDKERERGKARTVFRITTINVPEQVRPSPCHPSLQIHCRRPEGNVRLQSAFGSHVTISQVPSAKKRSNHTITRTTSKYKTTDELEFRPIWSACFNKESESRASNQ